MELTRSLWFDAGVWCRKLENPGKTTDLWPRGYGACFVLNTAELEIYHAHKCNQRTIGPVNAHLIS